MKSDLVFWGNLTSSKCTVILRDLFFFLCIVWVGNVMTPVNGGKSFQKWSQQDLAVEFLK